MTDFDESEAPCMFFVNKKESKKIGGDRSINWGVGVAYSRMRSKVPRGYAKYSDSSSERLWSKLREVPNGTARHVIIVRMNCALSQGALHSRDGAATPDDYRSSLWPPTEDRVPRAARTKVKRGVEIISRAWRYLNDNMVIQRSIFTLNEFSSSFVLHFYFCKSTRSERNGKKWRNVLHICILICLVPHLCYFKIFKKHIMLELENITQEILAQRSNYDWIRLIFN